jgi:multidrug efflux system outer membrane protein
VPIFTGGRNKANLQVAELQKEIEIANYEKAIQTAFREVADALAISSTINERIKAQSARVDAARRRNELSQQRFDAGVDSYLPVLLSQQELFAAQQDLVRAQLDRVTNQSSLFAALGGGWEK